MLSLFSSCIHFAIVISFGGHILRIISSALRYLYLCFSIAKQVSIGMVVPWDFSSGALNVIAGRFEIYVDFGEKTLENCLKYGLDNGFNYVGAAEGRCWGSKLPYFNLGSVNDVECTGRSKVYSLPGT